MSSKAVRQQRHEKQQRQKVTSTIVWVAIGIAVLAVIGFIAFQGVRPAAGEAVPIMVSEPHIHADSDPGQYNSDPPTSGLHYATEAEAGFHDENIYT